MKVVLLLEMAVMVAMVDDEGNGSGGDGGDGGGGDGGDVVADGSGGGAAGCSCGVAVDSRNVMLIGVGIVVSVVVFGDLCCR